MRKILFIIAAMAALATGAKAQDRIFVYRNDGGFDAFLKSEVDSMTLSHEDAEGKYHAGWETQLIHTPDSTYRIPLAAIDSISFFAPPTILNKDVFILTAEHDAYITRADTVSFTFAPGTPEELLPAKGNLVVSRYDCTSFPDGIVARVTYMAEDAAGMHYECERAGIDEVFDQILLYEECAPAQDTKAEKSTKTSIEANATIWDETYKENFEKDGTSASIEVNDKASLRVLMRKTLGSPFYFKLELENKLDINPSLTAISEAQMGASFDIIKEKSIGRIPIPYTPLFFVPKISMAGYFDLTGEVKLEAGLFFNRLDMISFEYKEGEWGCNYSHKQEGRWDIAQLSMEGAAEVGISPELLFSFCGTATGVGVNFSAGLKEYVNFKFDALEYFDTGAYAAIKESYANTTAPYSISVFAQAGLFDSDNSPRWTKTYSDEKQIGNDKFIVPEFSEITCTDGTESNSEVVSTNISRDLLLPTNVGFAVYDDENNLISKKYSSATYTGPSEWPFKGLSEQFSRLESGEYTVYPLIKIFDKELLATPSGKFTITDMSPLIGSWLQVYWLEDGLWWHEADEGVYVTFTPDHLFNTGEEAGHWETDGTSLTMTYEMGSFTYTYEFKDGYLYFFDYSEADKPYVYVYNRIGPPAELLGTWQNTGDGYQYMEITETSYSNYSIDEYGKYGEYGTYTYNGNIMYMVQTGESRQEYTVKVVKLTETDLVLRYEEYDENGNLTDSYGYSYKKLK